MNFSEALELMKKGHQARRKIGICSHTYIVSQIGFFIVDRNGILNKCDMQTEDILADDWEIIEDIQESKLSTHKKYLEEWKAEIEDIMSRKEGTDISNREIRYQELYLWSIRVGVIDECLEHIKEIMKTDN